VSAFAIHFEWPIRLLDGRRYPLGGGTARNGTVQVNGTRKGKSGTYDGTVWDHLAGRTSAPFKVGDHGQIAVKVIDDGGNESLVVKGLKDAELR